MYSCYLWAKYVYEYGSDIILFYLNTMLYRRICEDRLRGDAAQRPQLHSCRCVSAAGPERVAQSSGVLLLTVSSIDASPAYRSE